MSTGMSTATSIHRSTQPVAVITGASRGIGAAIAQQLAAEGTHVVLVARDVKALEAVDDAIQAAGGTTTLAPMDLREPICLDGLAAEVFRRFGRCDAIVGAAAVMGMLGPAGHLKPSGWDEVMAVNVTANWRLIRAFDPLLRAAAEAAPTPAQPRARPFALFLTDASGRQALHSTRANTYWANYAASKAALEALVHSYAAEVVASGIAVTLADPGPTRTALRARAFPGADPTTLQSPEVAARTALAAARAGVAVSHAA